MENNIDNALIPTDGVPVGTILSWAGPTNLVPPGWLICNGEPIYQNQFPALCAILQDYWGRVNPVSGEHTLPDLRSMVLRGVNGSRNDNYKDPEITSRISANARPNDVGSFQQDAFQGHWHSFSWTHNPSYGGDNNTDGGDERNGHFITQLSITDPITDGKSGIPRTSSETRPKNAYVHYIIKAI
jgi:hypothetical protein